MLGFRLFPHARRNTLRDIIFAAGLVPLCLRPAMARTLLVAPLGAPFASVQAAVLLAIPGDTLLVQAGVYHEAVSFPIGGSALTGYITLRAQPGAILDGTGQGPVGIGISGKNYIRVIGMEIRNFTGSGTPIGISVDGSASNLVLQNNVVHNIDNPTGNAHGIAFYGNAATPISNILVDGNSIHDCRLGQSESLVLNGNVTNFTVSNNVIHDNDNIGIDFIGFEGTGPLGSDQARNGACFGNTIYNISSKNNPTYGGDQSADGIYVDGGRSIVIERNRVSNCDIGIEVASEHQGKVVQDITVRSNFVSGSFQANLLAGGYASNKGNALDVRFVNNVTYHGTGGELALQYNCDSMLVSNNIFVALASQAYLQNWGGNDNHVTVNDNLYFGQSASSPGDWGDVKGKYTDPRLVNPAALDFHLASDSPARDAGLDLGNDASGHPIVGTQDIDGQTRVSGSGVDLGADELTAGTTGVTGMPKVSFRAFPNPSWSGFRISAGEGIARAVVFDVSGRPVEDVREMGASEFTIGERLAPGIYQCVLEGETGRKRSARLIKLR